MLRRSPAEKAACTRPTTLTVIGCVNPKGDSWLEFSACDELTCDVIPPVITPKPYFLQASI